MKIATKKIGKFLKSLTDVEYEYMRQCMRFRDLLKDLIEIHKLDKAGICAKFIVSEEDYESFIKGDYIYSVHDMAVINHLYITIQSQKLEDSAPFQIVTK